MAAKVFCRRNNSLLGQIPEQTWLRRTKVSTRMPRTNTCLARQLVLLIFHVLRCILRNAIHTVYYFMFVFWWVDRYTYVRIYIYIISLSICMYVIDCHSMLLFVTIKVSTAVLWGNAISSASLDEPGVRDELERGATVYAAGKGLTGHDLTQPVGHESR